jgi:hypothetical protein
VHVIVPDEIRVLHDPGAKFSAVSRKSVIWQSETAVGGGGGTGKAEMIGQNPQE